MSARTMAIGSQLGEPWRLDAGAVAMEPLSFVLPASLEAHEPVEARGRARDDVRLMVSFVEDDSVVHTRFRELPTFLRAGDVLVVNTSATINAALAATRPNGEHVDVHFSQRLPSHHWVIELRRPTAHGTAPLLAAQPGECIALRGGGVATLIEPYRPDDRHGPNRGGESRGDDSEPRHGDTRLWLARVDVRGDTLHHLDRYGSPIRYGYVPKSWPLPHYQTVFAHEPGSAEMPSAGRAFTPRLVETLVAKGVTIAPILLHTGVASLETHEPPYPEFFRVSAHTARVVTDARRSGGRIVAVGTTAVRALESVAAGDGTVAPGEGWTDLVITPARRMNAVDALLTGFHEPRASHLAMLEAIAGRRHLEVAYEAAVRERYLWHEFGDLHLILPSRDGAASVTTTPRDPDPPRHASPRVPAHRTSPRSTAPPA